MNNKILIICGPTATGKTSLGLELAEEFNGEIISADSRQVYKGMDIGTGKGLSANFQFSSFNFQDKLENTYYSYGNTKIWGYDLAEPQDDFSIAQYRELMLPVIEDIWGRNKLPIIVGGTGFYINALVNPPETMGVPANEKLRNELDVLSVEDLQQRLKSLNFEKYSLMNNSDSHNPRRLIRAIELESENSRGYLSTQPRGLPSFDLLWVGLSSVLEVLKKKVEENVKKRATEAFAQEIKSLEKSGLDWNSKEASATGYKEWKRYLDGLISKDQAIKDWVTREHQYQKRQMTWFKKEKQINWFDLSDPNLFTSVADQVQAWYS